MRHSHKVSPSGRRVVGALLASSPPLSLSSALPASFSLQPLNIPLSRRGIPFP